MEQTVAGRGFLSFEKIGEQTVVTEAFSKSPLKILTPRNKGKSSWAYSSNFGGGFVGGDSIDINIDVLPGAKAVFMSQASTKVYGSEDECRQVIKAHVGAGGVLYSIPDPVVCFSGAKFYQSQTFTIEENASLLMIDTLHCGRNHSGERWAFDSYKNEIHILKKNKKVFVESLLLDKTCGDLKMRQSRFNALSLLFMMGPAFKINMNEIHDSISDQSLKSQDDFVFSASPLEDDGLVIRMAAVSTETMSEALREILSFLPQHLGDDPWARKW